MARAPRVVPFNPSPRDADLDQIVQEGTIWERPRGADIIYLTGRVWDQTGREPLRSDVRIVYNGREYSPGDGFRFDSSSVGAQAGVIGDRAGTIGDRVGTIAPPPSRPKPTLRDSEGTVGIAPPPSRPTSIAEATRPAAPPPPPRPTLGESRGTLDSPPKPPPPREVPSDPFENIPRDSPVVQEPPPPPPRIRPEEQVRPPSVSTDEDASAKRSILRVRDRWGRKKRDNERRYEEERIVPSMEEAVEAEVQEERVDQIVAQVEAVDKALDEIAEVADVPESSSIDVLVAEDVEEILRIRRQNTADHHVGYYDPKGERIYATRSKYALGASTRDEELKIDVISFRDRREYEEMLAEVLEREAFADKLAAITGFSFPDEGGIVNNLYDSPDDVPEEVLEAVAELVRNTKFIDKFIGDQEPPEDLKQLFRYATQLANKNESTHRETVQLRVIVDYRRKLLTDPPKYVTRTELAQRVGFSSWEEAREASLTDRALSLHLEKMEIAARYGYDFYDDTVRDLKTEIAEAAYKVDRSDRAGKSVSLKRDNGRFGVGNQVPKDVTSEDVERLIRDFVKNANKLIEAEAWSPEVRAIIAERVRAIEAMSPEEVETLVLNYVREVMEDPDTRIGVMISPEGATGLKSYGRYLTTHSKLSASRSDDYDAARVVYETGMLQMPLDPDTRADLAPSSGFLIPGARMRAAKREAEEKYVEEFGVPYDPANATPEQHAFFENARISQASVGIEAYADDVVVLNPSVIAKSRFTEGDSFNEMAMTSLMQNPDGSPLSDQQLRNALFGRGTTTPELSSGNEYSRTARTTHTLGNFFVAAALGLDPAVLGRSRGATAETRKARDAGDIDRELAIGARALHGGNKVSEWATTEVLSAGYIETMTFGGFHTSEIESASEGIRDILDLAIPAEVQQSIESYSGQFLPTSAFVEENIEQTTRSALNRAAAATGTDLPETGGTAKLLTARAGELPGKFVSTFKTMEVRAGLKSRRDLLLELEADPDANPEAIAFLKNEIEILLQEAADLDKGKDIAVVAHTSSSDGWPSYLQVDHPSIVAQIHAATDKLSPEVRPERVIVSFDAPYGGGKYVHGQGGVIYIHPAALDWKDASFNINQKDLATRLAKAGATSPEEFDAFFRPSQAWVDDIIIHEGFHRVDFLLAKAGKDPQAAASLLSSPEMAAAFDEWLTLSTPFLLEYFEGVDKADLRMHEFAYLGELLGVTGTDRDEAARRKLVQLYAARVKKPVESVDPEVALKEERWRLISEVYAEMARLDAKGIPFPNSEILIDGMTPPFSRIYEGSDGSGDVLRAAFADAAASLSDLDDAVGAAQAGLDSALRDVASDVSASVDDIDDTVESLRVGAIPVRRGLYDGVDGAYVPDPVTRDDIARNLGFADADELDAAIADDPIMANNARILEELATYGFDIGVVGSLSADEARARYEAAKPGSYMATRHVSKPVDTAEIKDIMDGMASKLRKSLEEADALPQTRDRVKQSAEKRELLERIEATSPEEAEQLLLTFMRDIFDDPDTTMAVNTGFLDEVMASGRFLAVREAPKNRSEGGDGYARYDTERALLGLHNDTPGSLSPAYGFVVPGAQRRAAREKVLKQFGARLGYFDDGTTGITWNYSEEITDEVKEIGYEIMNDLYPGVMRSTDLPDNEARRIVADAIHEKIIERYGLDLNILKAKDRKEAVNKELKSLGLPFYGDGVILIDPKVMHRSTFTQGDTVNGAGRPVHYSRNMTDQQLLDMAARAERNPEGRDRGEALLARAILGYDSRSLNRSKVSEETTGVRYGEVAPLFDHDYIEAQIFGAFTTEEILTATDGKSDFKPAPYAPAVPTDLTPESEVAAIRAQLAAERADEAGDEVASFMARSVDDIVPESTDIPGGGVVETDDGGFWVSGPPPVGFTEEGKARWERGVELLRERPELFKTQVIADDGLPVPEDERPGLADIGSVYDALPSDDAVAAMTVRREIEKAWQAEITRAIVLNKIDIGNPREVWGTENDERSEAWQRYGYAARAERGMWENLPQGLLHVTTGLSGLQDGGFKTRAQLRDESGEAPAGLGGGVSDAISFTTDPLVADSIVRGIHEMREAVRDDTGPAAVERMKSEIAAWTKSMPENERKKLLSATPSTMEERGDFYREYSYWRQYNVPNRPDPLFWTPNYQAYADLDPNEVGVVTVNPSVDGARGWQVSGMGEWRTIPEAVDIVQSEARPTVVDDMTATLDELDTVRSSAPDFGLPPGPEKLTGWDKDRLTGASVPDIHEGKPRPVADVVDGVHLREDQKALKTVVAELSTEDDLLPLQKKLEEAFELGGSLSGKQRTDATYEIFAAINDLITSRQRDTTGFTPSQMREYEKEVAENEAWVGSRIAKAIQIHWGEARSEVFHWDFLSERVKTVLGEEFGIDVSHEPSEIDAGIEEVFEIQELLTPFIDAWVRGQYSTTQKYLEDAGITELSVFRGTYIPNVVGDDDGLPSGREPSVTRGLESWSTDIGIALGFAGNKYGTADDRIEEMAEVGELGEPTHVLQHDVVPAQLIMGIGYLDNPRIITGALGQGEESEIVVLGSSRPVNWLSNDLLKPWRSERPEGGYDFKIKEAAVFAYLSTGLWPKFS